MHIGNLRSALYAYLFAKANDGHFLLRIEDTDQDRLVEGAVDIIYNTLKDVGLFWDEGPDIGGNYGPYVQSQRKPLYMPYAEQLISSGHAYRCFCTEKELEARRAEALAQGDTYKYDKHCLRLSRKEIDGLLAEGQPYVIRQNVPLEGSTSFTDLIFGTITVENSQLDDNVLIKADGMPTYNFANVVDDHLMAISHVMRGTEYLSSTPKYNLLYQAFGWEIPQYIHMTPIMKDAQKKLSKRHGDASYEDLLAKGYLKEAIINYVALLGWNPGDDREIFSLEELIKAFSVEGMSKSPAIFDPLKLTWMNAEYIRALPPEEFHQKILPYFAHVLDVEKFDTRRLAELMQPRCEVLLDVEEKIRFLAEMPDFPLSYYTNKRQKTSPETALPTLEKLLPIVESVTDWTEESIQAPIASYIETNGLKNGVVLWPLRIAVSGKESTPGGFYEIAYLLGREETLRRLYGSIEKLKKGE
jgi:glutamyl-tRNA synthetase